MQRALYKYIVRSRTGRIVGTAWANSADYAIVQIGSIAAIGHYTAERAP